MFVRGWVEFVCLYLAPAAAGTVLVSCGSEQQLFDPERVMLEDGASLISLLQHQRDAIVLFYEPSDCVTCDQSLSSFLHPGDHPPVILLLTREPTAAEHHLLAMYRIRVTGVLSHEVAPPRDSPAAYLWWGGQLQAVSIPAALQRVRERVEPTRDTSFRGGKGT
jgi:hypothetical protein